MHPNVRQFVTQPVFQDPRNIASVPDSYRPAVYQDKSRKKQKKSSAKTIYDNKIDTICSHCTKPNNNIIHLLEHKCCHACYQIPRGCHPKSKWTGVDPCDAVHCISMCLANDWGVMLFGTMHYGDHATDDDSSCPHNCKTNAVSQVFDRDRRHKKIVHGDVQFFSSNAHRHKTLLSGDSLSKKDI